MQCSRLCWMQVEILWGNAELVRLSEYVMGKAVTWPLARPCPLPAYGDGPFPMPGICYGTAVGMAKGTKEP